MMQSSSMWKRKNHPRPRYAQVKKKDSLKTKQVHLFIEMTNFFVLYRSSFTLIAESRAIAGLN